MNTRFFCALAVSGIFAAASPAVFAEEQAPDWAVYMQSSANVAAISAGVGLASPCKNPLIFEETVTEEFRTIAIHCRGGSDDEFSVFIQFIVSGDVIVPSGFSLAG